MALDRQRIDELLTALCDELDGDWLLVGGAFCALWLNERRQTEDIDIIGMRGEHAERMAVMSFCAAHGLPVEIVNSAADFFVRRIVHWQAEVEPWRSGKRGRILRPSPTLFLLLKIGRLSEQDLEDCLALLQKADRLDHHRVLAAIDALPTVVDSALEQRRRELRGMVSTWASSSPRA
jgi:hypothetical protein